jgi:hypothetical protein
MGPEINELEEKLAAYVGVKHALACASVPMPCLWRSWPTVSFLETPSYDPLYVYRHGRGGKPLRRYPIFVDIDPVTYNIDPEKLEQAIASPADNALTAAPVR